MILVYNVKNLTKCVHTLRTGRHKRQADITLLFQYMLSTAENCKEKQIIKIGVFLLLLIINVPPIILDS